jgi:hypothetical protein
MSGGQGQKAAADRSANTSQNLGNQYNAQQQQMYQTLFGGPSTGTGTAIQGAGGSGGTGAIPGGSGSASTTGAPGGGSSSSSGGGALTPFLNPASLNVTSPTGVYGQQFTNAKQLLANVYGQNQQGIKTNAAQAGFGANTPAGFTTQQENQNAQGLSNATGQAFQQATTNQYQDALNNFWKSIGAAQTAMGQGEQGALQGTGTAAQTYANLYGTAAKSSPLGNILGAAGGALAGAALG